MNRYLALALVIASAAGCKAKQDDAQAASKPATQAKAPEAKDGLAQLVELAKNGPEHDKFPDADAIIAESRDDITLTGDGSVVEHHRSVVKLFDAQRGKEKFADVHVPYDTRRQTLEINRARTVNGDGDPHIASSDEISDIVPPRLADATIYSDVRERVVSFPAVDKDSVIELEYTRTTKPGPDAPLGGEAMLGTWNPIMARTVTLTVPSGVTPKFSVQGITLAPVEASSGNTHSYTFTLKDIPDRHEESDQIAEAAILPRLIYGFAPDWNRALQPVADRFLSKAVPQPLPQAIVDQANQLVAGAKTDTERAQALFKFVAHDIRSVDLPLGWAGYEPHAPDAVLANRYGDDRDKTGLLLALAAAVKLEGRPVLVRTGKVPVVAEVPTLAQFDRMIAKLTVEGKDTWVDASDENGQYALAFAGQDNLVLPVERKGAELGRRPPLDPSSSVSQTTASYTLNGNGDLVAKYSYALSGWYAHEVSSELRPLKGELLEQFFQREAAGLSASAADTKHSVGDTQAIAGSVEVAQEVKVPRYSEAQGNFRVFELPPSTLDLSGAIPAAALSKRKYPMWVGTPRTEKKDTTIDVPAGWKVASVPPKIDGAADGIKYSSECTAAGSKITCHTEVTLDKLDLSPEQYTGFRDAIAKLRAYERRVVLLTREG